MLRVGIAGVEQRAARRPAQIATLILLAVAQGCAGGHLATDSASTTTRSADQPVAAALPCDVPASRPARNQQAGTRAAQPTVTLWHSFGGSAAAALEELVATYSATSPQFAVKLVKIEGDDLLIKRWSDATPAERPSLVLMPQDAVRLLADSGTTAPFGDCLTRGTTGDLLPAVIGAYEVGGVLQAIPFNVSTPVLVFNRHVLEAAGVDTGHLPRTLAELRDAARHVRDSGSGTGFVIDTGPENGGSWFVEQWLAQAGRSSLDRDNGRSGLARSVRWRAGPAVEYLGWLRGMVEDGLALQVDPDLDAASYVARLTERGNPAAMTLQTCASMRDIVDIAALTPGFEPAAAPMPGPGAGGLVGGRGLFLTSQRSAAETAAAWRLASFLASARSQATLAVRTAYVPIRRSATRVRRLAEEWKAHPDLRVGYDQLSAVAADPASLGPQAGPERELRRLLAIATRAVIGGADPAGALASAADEADALLRDYARHIESRS